MSDIQESSDETWYVLAIVSDHEWLKDKSQQYVEELPRNAMLTMTPTDSLLDATLYTYDQARRIEKDGVGWYSVESIEVRLQTKITLGKRPKKKSKSH